jgi:hypothetical protein
VPEKELRWRNPRFEGCATTVNNMSTKEQRTTNGGIATNRSSLYARKQPNSVSS